MFFSAHFAQDSDLLPEDFLTDVKCLRQVCVVVGPSRDGGLFQGSNTFKGGRRERTEKPESLPLPFGCELQLTAKGQDGYFVLPWPGEHICSDSSKRCLKK